MTRFLVSDTRSGTYSFVVRNFYAEGRSFESGRARHILRSLMPIICARRISVTMRILN